MITITQLHNEARLSGSLAYLDSDVAPAALRLYDGVRPLVDAAPTGNLLVEITLTQPAGVVLNGQLSLTQQQDGLIMVGGVAVWGRFVNGAGVTCFDADVDDGTNSGEIQMATRNLYAGGSAILSSAVLG